MIRPWQFRLKTFLLLSFLAGTLTGLVILKPGLGHFIVSLGFLFGCAGLFNSVLILVSLVLTNPNEPDYQTQVNYVFKIVVGSACLAGFSLTFLMFHS